MSSGATGEGHAATAAANGEAPSVDDDESPPPIRVREGLRLTVRSGEARGTTARVTGRRMVIGRADGCDLTIPDGRVSRRHAAVEALEGGHASLLDLGSGNGTFVNGRRVESAVLEGCEQIQLGDTVLVASRGEPPHAASLMGDPRPTRSAVHRLRVQRSLRRATLLGGSAALGVALLAVLLFSGVLGGGDGTAKAVQKVVKAARPSTVVIDAGQAGGGAESGTGWVLDARKGLIVTNAHVADGRGDFQVGVEGELRGASLVGISPCEDLAVLRVGNPSGLRSLPLGRQSDLALGETVVAVGYPRDASLETNLTSTTGVVSVVRSSFRERALDHPRFPNVIQTDAAINPGNSGGPLLNARGEVIGVNTAIATGSDFERGNVGIGFAVPIDTVKNVAAQLITHGEVRRAFLGVSVRAIDRSLADLFRLPVDHGLIVQRVQPGSAAAKAGIRAGSSRVVVEGESYVLGGDILVALDGKPVTTLEQLRDAVLAKKPGDTIEVELYRGDAKKTVDVKLGRRS